MVRSSMDEKLAAARKGHYDLLPITKMFFEEGNPGGVKIALAKRGIMNPHMRLPLIQVSSNLQLRIENETTVLMSNKN
jgi:4-hydroxy-tetrahydrodipicolinate synthase